MKNTFLRFKKKTKNKNKKQKKNEFPKRIDGGDDQRRGTRLISPTPKRNRHDACATHPPVYKHILTSGVISHDGGHEYSSTLFLSSFFLHQTYRRYVTCVCVRLDSLYFYSFNSHRLRLRGGQGEITIFSFFYLVKKEIPDFDQHHRRVKKTQNQKNEYSNLST